MRRAGSGSQGFLRGVTRWQSGTIGLLPSSALSRSRRARSSISTWSSRGRATRGATASGTRRGDILATNFSPSPGTDKRGPTAALRSYCKMDFTRTPNGATLELKLHPSSVAGEEGLDAMVGLLRAFVDLVSSF